MLLRRGRGEDETEIPLSDHAKHTIVLSVSSPYRSIAVVSDAPKERTI